MRLRVDNVQKLGFATIIVTTVISIVSGKIATRCYSCRSRGELGDCKDPFSNNATSVSELPGKPVSMTSCPSGWCRKQMEGVRGPGDEYGAATERACLPLSPPDGEERCAEVIIRSKSTLLCVCRGDLCNLAPQSLRINYVVVTLPFITSVLFMFNTRRLVSEAFTFNSQFKR